MDTMEAREPVSADAMMCIGETNDAWQQSAVDADGWMVCRQVFAQGLNGMDMDTVP